MQNDLEQGLTACLLEYVEQRVAQFHMPGHKGGVSVSPDLKARLGEELFRLDETMIVSQRLDRYFDPQGGLARVLVRLAARVGSEHSRIVLNGPLSGLLAFLGVSVSRRRAIAVTRPCSPVLVDAAILVGAELRVENGELDAETGFPCPRTAELEASDCPNVVIQECMTPHSLGALARMSATRRVLIDLGLPGSGFSDVTRLLGAGAQVVVQHGAALGAASQVAFVHLANIGKDELRVFSQLVDTFHVSSVSYPLLASAERAITLPDVQVGEAIERADALARAITDHTSFVARRHAQRPIVLVHIACATNGQGAPTPRAVADYLWRVHGIEVGPTSSRVLTLCSPRQADDARLLTALREASKLPASSVSLPAPIHTKVTRALDPRRASRVSSRRVTPRDAIGRIATAPVIDPTLGLVAIAPGEVVPAELAEWFALVSNEPIEVAR